MTRTVRAIREYAWPRFKSTMAMGFVVVVAWSLLRGIGPVIEQSWFPVTGIATVYDTKTEPDGALLFRYKSVKHRDCDLLEYHWYYLDHGVMGPADITRSGITPSRPMGINLSVWWRVGLGEVLPGDFFIVLRYDCSLPWASRAVMGPFHLTH